jgi:serine protease DegQ
VERVQPSVVSVLTDVGEGSGVVYRADGVIVTNNHVIAGARSIEVAFADGQRAPARLLASDEIVDLAALRVEARQLPPAAFADTLPRVGELAIALGDPLGFENSVTVGVVSGLHRAIPGSAQQSASLVDLIQTDAPISPGNSGGALVGASGKVIGINVAYLPPSTGSVSLGFAIPSATVIATVDELLRNGRAEHAFLGIGPTTLTPSLAQQFGLVARAGVLILDVTARGPAAAAGIRPGDVLTAIDGTTLETAEDLLAQLRKHKPGDTVSLRASRGNEQIEVRARLTDRPD